jgi:cobalt-zinc-cadmium efflux system membrane fusion protein
MTIQGIRPLLLAAALLGLTACGERTAPPSAASAARPDPMEIALDDSTRSRVSTGAVGTSTVMETVRIAGRIEVNQYRTARIGAPITGRISQIDAELGQRVRAGQVLAEINSPELAQAQLTFLRANSQQQQLTKAVERPSCCWPPT